MINQYNPLTLCDIYKDITFSIFFGRWKTGTYRTSSRCMSVSMIVNDCHSWWATDRLSVLRYVTHVTSCNMRHVCHLTSDSLTHLDLHSCPHSSLISRTRTQTYFLGEWINFATNITASTSIPLRLVKIETVMILQHCDENKPNI